MELRKDRIGARRLHQWKHPFQSGVDDAGRVAHVEIDRVKRLAQMPFRIVVEAAAVKTFVAVRDRPFDDVMEDALVVIEV